MKEIDEDYYYQIILENYNKYLNDGGSHEYFTNMLNHDISFFCFGKIDSLYYNGKKIIWCFESCIKSIWIDEMIDSILVEVPDYILKENSFDTTNTKYLMIENIDFYEISKSKFLKKHGSL